MLTTVCLPMDSFDSVRQRLMPFCIAASTDGDTERAAWTGLQRCREGHAAGCVTRREHSHAAAHINVTL